MLVGQAEPGSLGRPFELLLDAHRTAGRRASTELDPSSPRWPTRAAAQVERLQAGLQLVRPLIDAGGPSVDRLRGPALGRLGERRRCSSGSPTCAGRRLLHRHLPAGRGDPPATRWPTCSTGSSAGTRSTTSASIASTSAETVGAPRSRRPAGPPPYRAAVALHNRTGGNPFFLEELLRARGDDDLDELCDQPLPWSLAEALRRQLDDLDPAEQRIVEAAAVLGRRIPFDLLAAVTGNGEAELIAALRDLVRARACWSSPARTSSASGTRWPARRSPTSCSAGSAAGCTRLALDALLAAGSADSALVAHHARGAGRYDDMVAAARRGLRHLPRHRLAVPGAAAGRDGPRRGCPTTSSCSPCAARAAWLAGLLDDARRATAGAGSPSPAPGGDRADALRLLVRLGLGGRPQRRACGRSPTSCGR